MSDVGLRTVLLLVTFAAFVTIHVATVYGLATRRRFGSAALGFFVPPVAPIAAFRNGMTVRALVWLVAAIAYVACLWLAA